MDKGHVGSSFSIAEFLDVKIRAIRTHGRKREQVARRIDRLRVRLNKNVSARFSRRPRRVVAQKELRDRRRNRSVVERAINHRPFRNPWRYQDRGHAYTKPVECKRLPSPGDRKSV